MMFKNIKKVIILFVLLIGIFPYNKCLAAENEGEILIIYDEYKEYASNVNSLNYVIKMALTIGRDIDVRKINSYTIKDLSEAYGIIVLSNKEGSFKKEQIEELYRRSPKLLWIGKNSLDEEVVKFNFNSKEEIFEIKKKINEKFNNNENVTNKYLIIDKVYPYDNLNLLIEKADYLYEQGIPFLVSAMEVYGNLEFDAMKRYTEALRYCQSRGGTIILGDPYVYDNYILEEELIQKLSVNLDAFIKYKVYPIGLTINDSYLYRQDRKRYLSNASTIIVDENDNLNAINFEKYFISGFKNVLLKIDDENLDFKTGLFTDVAIGVQSNVSIDNFKNKIESYKKNGIELSNPNNLEGELKFCNNKIINTKDSLIVNGTNVTGNRFLSNKKLYGEENEKLEELVEEDNIVDLSRANKGIFIITISGVVIFIVFLLYGFKIDRRKYFK